MATGMTMVSIGGELAPLQLVAEMITREPVAMILVAMDYALISYDYMMTLNFNKNSIVLK